MNLFSHWSLNSLNQQLIHDSGLILQVQLLSGDVSDIEIISKPQSLAPIVICQLIREAVDAYSAIAEIERPTRNISVKNRPILSLKNPRPSSAH